MALNFSDRESLRPQLVPRLREAVRKYFLYVIGGGGAPSPERLAWVKSNMNNIGDWAEKVSQYCMSEQAFIDNGTSISDAVLSARAEFVLQNYTDLPA